MEKKTSELINEALEELVRTLNHTNDSYPSEFSNLEVVALLKCQLHIANIILDQEK